MLIHVILITRKNCIYVCNFEKINNFSSEKTFCILQDYNVKSD